MTGQDCFAAPSRCPPDKHLPFLTLEIGAMAEEITVTGERLFWK
jgi:hypothetical protein